MGIYADCDIFLISEVMWEREQVISETSWPIDYKIMTHEKLGKSNLAYSLIMYNERRTVNLQQIESQETFTTIEFGNVNERSSVSVAYRFNNRSRNWS